VTARYTDRNGWYEIPANPISRAGVFAYLGASIDAPDPGKMYQVYRAPAELASPETMESFRLVPWINDHEMLGQATDTAVPAEQRGVHGVLGERIWYDQEKQTLFGNLKVWSSNLQKTIDAGKNNLSLGYVCKYVFEPGITPDGQKFDARQVQIRGNHIASVQQGRMGQTVAVMDEAHNNFVVTFDAKDLTMPETFKKRNPTAYAALMKKATLLGTTALIAKGYKMKPGKSVAAMDAAEETAASDPSIADALEVVTDLAGQFGDLMDAMPDAGGDDDMEDVIGEDGKPTMDAAGKPMKAKKGTAAAAAAAKAAKAAPANPAAATTDGKATMDAIEAAIAKAVAPLTAKIAELESNSPATMLSAMADRDKLAAQVKPFTGAFDHAPMTAQSLAEYAVTKLSIPTTKGQEINSVTAWLHGRDVPRASYSTGMDGGNNDGKSSVDAYLAA
jgi:hypothetical protein